MRVRGNLSQSDSEPNSRFLSYFFVDFFSELNIVLEDQVIRSPLVIVSKEVRDGFTSTQMTEVISRREGAAPAQVMLVMP